MVGPKTTPFDDATQESKLQEFVSLALEKKKKGDSAGFNTILKQLSITTDPTALKKWYYVLRQRVSTISQAKDFQELVTALLKFDHWENSDVTEDFVSLMGDLVSSNSCYVVPCFEVLVKNFLPRRKPAEEIPRIISDLQNLEHSPEWCVRIYDNTHRALRSLINLVPSGTNSLFPILLEYFPDRKSVV